MNIELKTQLAANLYNDYKSMWGKFQPSTDYTMLFPQIGDAFQPGESIMFVGKANNGWKDDFTTIYDPQTAAFNPQAADITWLQDSFYQPLRDLNWRGNKSAFFRVVKAITLEKTPNATDSDWTKHIVFTDLYKIAPQGGGNPSVGNQRLQFPECVAVLREEINFLKPAAIVFLTSEWERDFLNALAGNANFFDSLPTIGQGNTACRYGTLFGIPIVCCPHPQGKQESEIVNNVCSKI